MTQQQLVPEPQGQDVGGQAYRFKAQQRRKNEPKEEHPATFEETVPPYSYPAQDRVTYTEEKAQQKSDTRPRLLSGEDGDAFEMGYRPYRQYNYRRVPPWARPQRHNSRHILRWLATIVLILLAIKILPLIILSIVALLGVVAFVFVLPFIILLGLLVVALLVVIVALSGMRGMARTRHNHRWGRP